MKTILKDQDIKIGYLADRPEWVPVIADWIYNQWYDHSRSTLKEAQNDVAGKCNYNEMPLALVAVKGQKIVGTVELNQFDMDTRKDLSPWLANLYVPTEHRNKGIGSLLVAALIEKAKALDINKLYLFTPDAQYLYDKLGWQTVVQTQYRSKSVTIMEKSF